MRKIEFFSEEKTAGNGQKFTAYKVKMKDGKFMTMKLTRDCPNQPKDIKHGFVFVNDEDCNVSKTGVYPCLWVKNIQEYAEIIPESTIGEFFDEA